MLDRQTEQHLQAACTWVDTLLERQVSRLRIQRDRTPDEFRGLVIADSEADALLSSNQATSIAFAGPQDAALEACSANSTINQIASRFELSALDQRILILALVAEIDLRYQTLFAYVQNDVTRRLPTADLILKLLCSSREEQWHAHASFSPQSALFRNTLLQFVAEPYGREVPMIARSLIVAPRVRQFLLGHIAPDESLTAIASLVPPRVNFHDFCVASDLAEQLWHIVPLLRSGGVVVLRGRGGAGKFGIAQNICNELQIPLMVLDVGQELPDKRTLASLLRRECILLNAALYLKLGAAAAENQQLRLAFERCLSGQPFPIFLSIEDPQTPALELPGKHCFRFELPVPGVEERRNLWLTEFPCSDDADRVLPLPFDELAGEFRFTPGLIHAVAHEALSISLVRCSDSHAVTAKDIRQAARNRCNIRLRGLAQRVDLLFDWDDLVLPQGILQQLHEICAAVRLRHVVHGRWGFEAKVGADAGISVLFSGVSGTGKTMAAGVLARGLELELYKVDLSCVVSKYIGETEQNLRRIFEEAEHSSAVLFFDEADALFGKRSEVKDAHDRYANIEVAYLLQKMEQFPGLAVLATNLSRNIDPAFMRRLQHVIEFPFPDIVHRERIWRAMFPPLAPQSDDIDFKFLSRQFELSGGNIRNVVAAAAFLAADADQSISMEHLVQAIGREMQKMGKLPSKADFQGHLEVISRQNNGRH